jgi:RNA polymerase sigma factor (sigma-70 family)
MEDRDIVAAIVAGEPAGLAEAYDRYGVPLYAYSCSMLGEPADAADAVQDAFLIAAARLPGLRDPDKLRPWLYAVARNECLRRLRAAARTVASLDEAHDLPAAAADPGLRTEQADLRELVRDAIDGLNPGERDVIELSLGHDLDGDDLADALGVSRNHAHALLSRARGQLERSLGALIVARAGRAACAALDTMLAGWDGRLTVLTRKRIGRHIERCEVCGERKRRELSPALFAGMVPLAAVLPGFRDQLLRIMADRTPAGMAHRLAVANRAGPFGPAGFPRPIRLPAASPWHRVLRHPLPHSHTVVTGAATSVAAAGVIAVVVMGGPHHASAAAPGTTHGTAASPGAPSPAHGGPAGGGRSGLLPLAAVSPGVTSPGAPGASGAAGTPGAGASSTAPAGSSSSAAATSPATAPAASSTSASATASQGTLAPSAGTVHLVSVNGTKTGTFTITASGGPVSDYSITVGSALAGKITVSPATGSLASGASVTITVTSASLVTLDGSLTIDPGGRTVSVVLAVGL